VSEATGKNDAAVALFVASCLALMLDTKHDAGGDLPSLFMKLSATNAEKGTTSWVRLEKSPRVNASVYAKLSMAPQKLYLAPSIGRGGSGVCFKALVPDDESADYLLRAAKVFRPDPMAEEGVSADPRPSQKQADDECELWKAAYGDDFAVHTFQVSKTRGALLMPYFPPFGVRDESVLAKVRATLQTNFHDKGLVYKDICWQHIGRNDDGSKAVVFDLGRVVERKWHASGDDDDDGGGGGDDGDDGWVERSVSMLRRDL